MRKFALFTDFTPDRFGLKERQMDDLILLEPREDLDQFIAGIGSGFGGETAIVYHKDKLLQFWAKQYCKDDPQLSIDDAYHMAVEWFEFNTIGAYVGPHTPIYISQDELEIFLEDYALKPETEPSSPTKEDPPSLEDKFGSLSNAEADIWAEAFGMAQAAGFELKEDNWTTLLETFLQASGKKYYLKSLQRWLDLRQAYPQAFEESGQISFHFEQPKSDQAHSDLDKNIAGWEEGLDFKARAALIDAQFKRDLARIFESAMK